MKPRNYLEMSSVSQQPKISMIGSQLFKIRYYFFRMYLLTSTKTPKISWVLCEVRGRLHSSRFCTRLSAKFQQNPQLTSSSRRHYQIFSGSIARSQNLNGIFQSPQILLISLMIRMLFISAKSGRWLPSSSIWSRAWKIPKIELSPRNCKVYLAKVMTFFLRQEVLDSPYELLMASYKQQKKFFSFPVFSKLLNAIWNTYSIVLASYLTFSAALVWLPIGYFDLAICKFSYLNSSSNSILNSRLRGFVEPRVFLIVPWPELCLLYLLSASSSPRSMASLILTVCLIQAWLFFSLFFSSLLKLSTDLFAFLKSFSSQPVFTFICLLKFAY